MNQSYRFRCFSVFVTVFAGLLFGCSSSNKQKTEDKKPVESPGSDLAGQGASGASALGGSEESSGDSKIPKAIGPVAHVDGEPVAASKFNDQMSRVTRNQKVAGPLIEKLKKRVVKKVVDDYLVDRAIDESGITVESKEVDKRVEKIKSQYDKTHGDKKSGSFKGALSQMGLSERDFRSSIEELIAIEKLLEKRGMKKPTDEEIKAFYENNKKRFKRPHQMHLYQILIKVGPKAAEKLWMDRKEKIQSFRKQITSGESTFEQVARQHSDGTSSGKGGDLGMVGAKRLSKHFGKDTLGKLKKLEKGKISKPIRTSFGWHLFKKTDEQMPGTLPFEAVKQRIRSHLKKKRLREGLNKIITSERQNSEINMHPENIQNP